MSDPARSEPRDLYDLDYLLTGTGLRFAELNVELDAKLHFRGRTVAGIEAAIGAKEERLRRLWSARLTHQMNELPPFDGVFRSLQRALREADFPRP
ncbi:MAG: nucleotidyl transferase AbiEii/AbiGii toxin family protein [Casimicrobiaceae bacterium]